MWYLYLLILVLVILVLWWALTRSSKETQTPEIHNEVQVTESRSAAIPQVEEAVPASPVVEAKPDDLVILEGIGPKVAFLLNQVGILTFQQLADVDLATIRDLLGANKLSFIDPTSWPDQARLAAAGDHEGLRALQDELKGGRLS